MARPLVQQTVSDKPLMGTLERITETLNREDRVTLRQLRTVLNEFLSELNDGALNLGQTGLVLRIGEGAPTAADASGSIYLRTDGGAGTTFYVREGAAWAPK